MLERACLEARRWCDQDLDLYASINLPPAYWQPAAIRRVIATIESFGLQADRVMIELTEEAAMTDIADLEPLLAEIHSQGLRLAIDDFGTGYSSLGRLRRLRPSMIKIDRSFVKDLPGDRDAGVLVETMITMAQKLGIQCLAEGIETEEQLRVPARDRLPARAGLPVRPPAADCPLQRAHHGRRAPRGLSHYAVARSR